MRLQSSDDSSWNGWVWKIPALLTTASTRPKESVAASTMAVAPWAVATESCDATAEPPERLDLTHHSVGHRGVAAVPVHRGAEVVDHDGGTSASEIERVEPAQSTTGAGHDDGLAGELDGVPLASHALRAARPQGHRERVEGADAGR